MIKVWTVTYHQIARFRFVQVLSLMTFFDTRIQNWSLQHFYHFMIWCAIKVIVILLTSFYATNWCIKTITYFKINVGSKKLIAVFWKTRSQTKEAAALEILKEEFDFCYLLPRHCFSFLGQSKGGKRSNRFLKAKIS